MAATVWIIVASTSSTPLTILITNLSFSSFSGTEMFCRDIALGIAKRGHRPVLYSPIHGRLASQLRDSGLEVIQDLSELAEPPDIIHGHHHVETMSALLHFAGVPAVFVCHDRTSWHDRAPHFPRILRYLAVDDPCRARLIDDGVPSGKTDLVLNAVDLERFRKGDAVAKHPKRALLFSHYASEENSLPIVREACRQRGIELDVAGNSAGTPTEEPENLLPRYDLIFAKARCALEAMATGRAVLLLDVDKSGPLVTPDLWQELRPRNFGGTCCTNPLSVDSILAQLDRYDHDGVEEVCRITRAEAGLESNLNQLEIEYQAVIEEWKKQPRQPNDCEREMKSASAYLKNQFDYAWLHRASHLEREVEMWKQSAEEAHRGWAALGKEYNLLVDAKKKK